ncbi:MAG: hypothetical protein QM770_01220 [Tepidisphaeraceae bacterium]
MPPSAFVRSPASTPNPLTTVSASQTGGSYLFSVGGVTGVATVASGSQSSPNFALTVTNNTGRTITGLAFSGLVAQLKDNSSNQNETLNASVTGLSGITASALNITAVSNNGDTSSTVSNPPLTKAYSPAAFTGLSFANNASFTVTWTDSDNGGTDAMFGLANLAIAATLQPTNVAPTYSAHAASSSAAPNYTFTVDFGKVPGMKQFSQTITATDSDSGNVINLSAGTRSVSGGMASLVNLSATALPGVGGSSSASLALAGTLGFSGTPYTVTYPLNLTDNVIGSPLQGSVTIQVVPEPAALAVLCASSVLFLRRRAVLRVL